MKKLLLILLCLPILFNSCKKEEEEPAKLAIGDTYQGGIIFYLDANGGGLIAAPSDQSTGAEWACFGTDITGADGIDIGTGNQNMIDIVNANCSLNTSNNLIAANICANLTHGGYSDWFLPSKDELNLIWLNLVDPDGDTFNSGFGDTNNLGGFVSNLYWSSTEYDSTSAWIHFLGNGDQVNINKSSTNYVRAIRAF